MWADDVILGGWSGYLTRSEYATPRLACGTGFTSKRGSCGWREGVVVGRWGRRGFMADWVEVGWGTKQERSSASASSKWSTRR